MSHEVRMEEKHICMSRGTWGKTPWRQVESTSSDFF